MRASHPLIVPLRPLAIALGALVMVAAPACMWVIDRDDGNRLTVVSAPTEWPAGVDPHAPMLTLADGSEVRIDAAWLGWRRVALSLCGGSGGAGGSGSALGGVAHAHGGSSSAEVDAPLVEALVRPVASVAPGAPLALAELAPATGRYCRLSIGVGAVDAGADGAPDDGSFDGYSLSIDGATRESGEAAWRPFSLRETASFDVVLPLDRMTIEGGTTLEVRVSKAAGAWFEGVDLFADDAARTVLERVQSSIALEVSP